MCPRWHSRAAHGRTSFHSRHQAGQHHDRSAWPIGLTDFGIASIVRSGCREDQQQVHHGYAGPICPPEVITGKPADHRGDIFCPGVRCTTKCWLASVWCPGPAWRTPPEPCCPSDFPELGDLDEQLDEKSFGVLGRMLAPTRTSVIPITTFCWKIWPPVQRRLRPASNGATRASVATSIPAIFIARPSGIDRADPDN